ncbi:MAG: benzoate-CoA ligase family protein, partial [Gemmatimonadota bacterium]|nr:benzoate-CoA ligase family protein [Gemmatimonadota bacterium]
DGWFTYQGRADGFLKVAGKWFSPREAEECLLAHPGVREAAVVGVENEDGLVVPVAFVVLPDAPDDAGERAEATEAALRAHARTHLESYKVPRAIHVLADLPRTHLGKVDRGALKRSGAP